MTKHIPTSLAQKLMKKAVAYLQQRSARSASIRHARGLLEGSLARMSAHEAQVLRAQALAALSVVR